MAITVTRKGYGQVEPNHLSGIVTGQIYAQLPVVNGVNKLEQGQFAKYNYALGQVDFSGEGEWMLIYNEEKLYDERKQSHKDFCYKKTDFTDEKMYPRLIKTNVGDIFTTNTFGANNSSEDASYTGPALATGDYLTVNSSGFLAKATGTGKPADGMVWQVVKEYTMPDGQPGVKIQRIQ